MLNELFEKVFLKYKEKISPYRRGMDEFKKEGHYDHVEVCVKKDDAAAIGLYEKHGFVDSGYIDEDVPDSLNMICYFTEGGAK